MRCRIGRALLNTCSVCGTPQEAMPLHVRSWERACGATYDRDVNCREEHPRRRAGGEAKRLWELT